MRDEKVMESLEKHLKFLIENDLYIIAYYFVAVCTLHNSEQETESQDNRWDDRMRIVLFRTNNNGLYPLLTMS